MFFIVCYSCFFCLLQLDVSQFLVKFHQLLGIEPEVGVANVHVVAVFIRYDFYLLHILFFLPSPFYRRGWLLLKLIKLFLNAI